MGQLRTFLFLFVQPLPSSHKHALQSVSACLVIRRGHPGQFFKGTGEVGDVVVADHLADLIDLIAHIPEEAHRCPHPIAGDIAVDALSGVLLKETTEMPLGYTCLLYTSPSPRDVVLSRMPSSA